MTKILGISGVMVLAVSAAACRQEPQQQREYTQVAYVDRCDRAPNPAECRGWQAAGGDVDDYLAGGMTGYVMQRQYYNGQPQYVILEDDDYDGPRRQLRRPLPSRTAQLRVQQQRISNQRAEINRLRVERDAARKLAVNKPAVAVPARAAQQAPAAKPAVTYASRPAPAARPAYSAPAAKPAYSAPAYSAPARSSYSAPAPSRPSYSAPASAPRR